MGLVGHELYKVFSSRLFRWLIAAFLAACAFLFLNGQQYGPSRQTVAEYEWLAEGFRDSSEEATIAEMEKRIQLFSLRALRASLTDETDNSSQAVMLEMEQLLHPELYARVMARPETSTAEELALSYRACSLLLEQARYRKDYYEYLNSVQRNAGQLAGSPLFGRPGTFAFRNAQQTASAFSGLWDIEIEGGIGYGITGVTAFLAGDLLALLLVFAAVTLIFHDEYQKKLVVLQQTAVQGRETSICAKLGAVFAVTLGITMLYMACMLLLGALRYGYGDLSRSIQSVPEFRGCVYHLTAGQYFLLCFCAKLLVFLGAGFYFCAAFTFCKSRAVLLMLTALGPLALFFGLNLAVPAQALLNHLKYINPFYYLNGVKLFGEYRNLNFFTLPVNTVTAMVFTSAVVTAGSGIAACCRYAGERGRVPAGKQGRRDNRTEKSGPGLFCGEVWKLFLQERGLVLLLACLVLSLYLVHGYSAVTFREDEQIYRAWMQYFSGEWTKEKADFYETLAEEFSGRSEAGQADSKIAAFLLLQQDYNRLQQLQRQGVRAGMTDRFTGNAWLSADEASLKNAVFFLTASVFVGSALYAGDVKRRMLPLLKSTGAGRGKLAEVRLGLGAAAVLLVYAIVYLPFGIFLLRGAGVPEGALPIQCLAAYEGCSASLTIGGLLAAKHVSILLSGFGAAALAVLLTVKTGNRPVAILVTLGIACLPLVLRLRGIDVERFTLTNGCLLPAVLREGGSLVLFCLQQLVIGIAAISCVCLTVREVCRTPKKKRG